MMRTRRAFLQSALLLTAMPELLARAAAGDPETPVPPAPADPPATPAPADPAAPAAPVAADPAAPVPVGPPDPAAIPYKMPSITTIFDDFEGDSYAGWTIEGDAFGTAPTTDALFPGIISGFSGHGFACTLHPRKGSTAKGRAVSREFTIDQPFITFKIGGGDHPGEACLNLYVDNKVVRTATGADSPILANATWDVSNLTGKKAYLEILDETTSAERGYIIVDDIRFTNGIDKQRQSDLENLVTGLKRDYPIPGIWAAIGYQGRIAGGTCIGLAKVEDPAKPASMGQRVAYGPATEALTGILAGICIAKGLLGYSTKVIDVVPSLVEKYDKDVQGMTVEQLLTHRAGLGAGAGLEATDEKDPAAARSHQAESILKLPRSGTPGTDTGYAAGAVIVGVMLEKLTGKTLEDLFKQELFDRFGMPSCMLGDPYFTETDPDIPSGYSSDGAKYKLQGGSRPHVPIWYQASAAWAAYGNVSDLAKLYTRLYEGRKQEMFGLPISYYEKFLSSPEGSSTTFAGFQSPATDILSEGGGTDRGQLFSYLNLKTGRSLVVAINSTEGDKYFTDISAKCLKWIQDS